MDSYRKATSVALTTALAVSLGCLLAESTAAAQAKASTVVNPTCARATDPTKIRQYNKAWSAPVLRSGAARVRAARKRKLATVRKLFKDAGVRYPPRQLFLRAFKKERVLEVWASSQVSGALTHVTSYRICDASGGPGPKTKSGDSQVPEGFYRVDWLKSKSDFHLAMHVNYPNAEDRKRKYTGSAIMIHGACASIGCLAMTDERIEELWLMVSPVRWRYRRKGGVPINIYPSCDTKKMIASTKDPKLKVFWGTLSQDLNWFDIQNRVKQYPWVKTPASAGRFLGDVVKAPAGFNRVQVANGSFAAWLRGLPLMKEGRKVRLVDGTLKGRQNAHHEVVDLDVIQYQECADAVMRLRAEYLWSRGQQHRIGFHMTRGLWVPWSRYRKGWRVRRGTTWARSGRAGRSHRMFLRYMRMVYGYAGTASLLRDVKKGKLKNLSAGYLLNQPARGGAFGHAVLVLDVAQNAKGEKVMLLGQSYMPAQEFHLLKNPQDAKLSPWYRVEGLASKDGMQTPEWGPFTVKDLYRFP